MRRCSGRLYPGKDRGAVKVKKETDLGDAVRIEITVDLTALGLKYEAENAKTGKGTDEYEKGLPADCRRPASHHHTCQSEMEWMASYSFLPAAGLSRRKQGNAVCRTGSYGSVEGRLLS